MTNNTTTEKIDSTRALRAGLLVASGETRPYITTAEACTCPDWKYRGHKAGPCKHMIAARMLGQTVVRPQASKPSTCDCVVYQLRGTCQHVPDDDAL